MFIGGQRIDCMKGFVVIKLFNRMSRKRPTKGKGDKHVYSR